VRLRTFNAAEVAAEPAAQTVTENPNHQCDRRRTSSGSNTSGTIGNSAAANLTRTISPPAIGAAATNSGTSSAHKVIQANAFAVEPAINMITPQTMGS
jgi:hypothetical protein